MNKELLDALNEKIRKVNEANTHKNSGAAHHDRMRRSMSDMTKPVYDGADK